MDFEIRPAATPADIDTVRDLWREYWASMGLAPEFQGFAEELRGLPGAYAPPAGLLLLAFVEGRAAATVGFRRGPDSISCEAKRMFVRPEFRGHGLGRKLLDRIKQEAVNRGYRTIMADTLPSMADALTLYRRYGFREREAYSSKPTPGAIRMTSNR